MSTGRYKTYSFILFAGIVLNACNRESNYSSIPYAPVAIRVDLSIYHTHLKNFYANQCFTKEDININTNPYLNIRAVGYGGVLVHSLPPTNPNNLAGVEYSAFDMACPNEADKNIRVYPDISGMYAVCEKCGSMFELTYGQRASDKNPSKENLKRLNASRTGNILEISPRYD